MLAEPDGAYCTFETLKCCWWCCKHHADRCLMSGICNEQNDSSKLSSGHCLYIRGPSVLHWLITIISCFKFYLSWRAQYFLTGLRSAFIKWLPKSRSGRRLQTDPRPAVRGKPPSAPLCCPQKGSFVPGPLGASKLRFRLSLTQTLANRTLI